MRRLPFYALPNLDQLSAICGCQTHAPRGVALAPGSDHAMSLARRKAKIAPRSLNAIVNSDTPGERDGCGR